MATQAGPSRVAPVTALFDARATHGPTVQDIPTQIAFGPFRWKSSRKGCVTDAEIFSNRLDFFDGLCSAGAGWSRL